MRLISHAEASLCLRGNTYTVNSDGVAEAPVADSHRLAHVMPQHIAVPSARAGGDTLHSSSHFQLQPVPEPGTVSAEHVESKLHMAYVNLAGDILHNFVDGLVIGATYMVSPRDGLTTTIAVVLHELPQEIADFNILIYSGLSTKKALLLNFLVRTPCPSLLISQLVSSLRCRTPVPGVVLQHSGRHRHRSYRCRERKHPSRHHLPAALRFRAVPLPGAGFAASRAVQHSRHQAAGSLIRVVQRWSWLDGTAPAHAPLSWSRRARGGAWRVMDRVCTALLLNPQRFYRIQLP